MSLLKQTEHNYGVLREFRFRDPELERQYRKTGDDWCLQPARWHAIWNFLTTILYLSLFIPKAQYNSAFWSGCAVLASSVAMFAALRMPVALPHVTFIFSGYCIALTSWLGWLMFYQDHQWSLDAAATYGPVLAHTQATDTDVGRMVMYLNTTVLYYSINTHVLYNAAQIFFIIMIPFSWPCACAIWTCPPAFVIAIICTGKCTFQVGIVVALRLVVISCFCTIMSILVGRMHRADFMSRVLLARELKASQMADSVLNHGLKNTMDNVASNIELFLNGEVGSDALQNGMASLRRGMRSCRERMVYLKLVAGKYIPTLSAVDLRDFAQQLVEGRNVAGTFVDHTVYLDLILCNLIFDNAINNAFQHGCPHNPAVTFTITTEAPTPANPLPPDHVRLVFEVANAINPLRPQVTHGFVDQMVNGQYVGGDPSTPALSDRIGLSHCLLAANQHGMTISLVQDEIAVRFRAVYDARLATQSAEALPVSLPDDAQSHFPDGLRFVCLDDSLPARRLVAFHINKWMRPSSVHCLGERESDVHKFVEVAKKGADIVIVDQNLEYSKSYLGSDLIKELRDTGFGGLICVRSANTSPSDMSLYLQCGAHCVIGKDLLGLSMMDQIKAAYVRRRNDGLLSLSSSATSPLAVVEAWNDDGCNPPWIANGNGP